jgi:hypothetical protein
MSRRLNLPVSTLFDMLKEVRKFFHFTIVLKDGPGSGPMANSYPEDGKAEQETPINS